MASPSISSPPSLQTGDHVSLGEFVSAYNRFSALVQRRIFKLERLQNYQEPDNESWREFQAGNVQLSLEAMKKVRAQDAEYDIEFFRRGLQFLRVHAVELPLTPYVEWELHSYLISAQYGETILISDVTEFDRSGVLWKARDFLLFDSLAALVHDYDSDGLLRGGWVCEDKGAISHYTHVAHEFTRASVPLAVFMSKHPS